MKNNVDHLYITIIYVFRYQTLAVATDASNKEDIGNKKISGKKLTVCALFIYLFSV